MSLLAGFLGGAAAGVQSHWGDVREKVAAEAKQAFQLRLAEDSRAHDEKMVGVRSEAAVNTAGTIQQNQLDFQVNNKDTITDMEVDRASKMSAAQAEQAEKLAEQYSGPQLKRKLAELRASMDLQKEYAEPGEQWVDVMDEQGNVTNQRNSKTGALKWSAKDRGANSSADGMKVSDLELKEVPEGFVSEVALGVGADYKGQPLQYSQRSGYVVDQSGILDAQAVPEEKIAEMVDAAVSERKKGTWYGGKKSDQEAFEGLTEEAFRAKTATELQEGNKPLWQIMGFNGSVRTTDELRQVMTGQQPQLMAGNKPQGGMLSEANMTQAQPVSEQPSEVVPALPAINDPFTETEAPEQAASTPEQDAELLAQFGIESPDPLKYTSPFKAGPYGEDSRFKQGAQELGGEVLDAAKNTFQLPAKGMQIGREATADLIRSELDIFKKNIMKPANSMKARAKDSTDEKEIALIESFFDGKPSLEAANAIIRNEATTDSQKQVAQAYIRMLRNN
jgi:hypothetical protein